MFPQSMLVNKFDAWCICQFKLEFQVSNCHILRLVSLNFYGSLRVDVPPHICHWRAVDWSSNKSKISNHRCVRSSCQGITAPQSKGPPFLHLCLSIVVAIWRRAICHIAEHFCCCLSYLFHGVRHGVSIFLLYMRWLVHTSCIHYEIVMMVYLVYLSLNLNAAMARLLLLSLLSYFCDVHRGVSTFVLCVRWLVYISCINYAIAFGFKCCYGPSWI